MDTDWLIDTNVFVRLARRNDPQRRYAVSALSALDAKQSRFYTCPQVCAELYNVLTRPLKANGLDLTPAVAREFLLEQTRPMSMLYETDRAYARWLYLTEVTGVSGVKVHDARLAAILSVNGIRNILTFNHQDFTRFEDVTAIDPEEFA